jgi:hypothetical protein
MLDYAPKWEIYEWPRDELEAWLEFALIHLGGRPVETRDRGVLPLIGLLALTIPPVVCLVLFGIWRRRYPNAARLAHIRRSRAATIAVQSLRSPSPDRAREVSTALTSYIRTRFGLPEHLSTAADLSQALCRIDMSRSLVRTTVSLVERCDVARFAPGSEFDSVLTDEAERLILEWEGQA